MSSDTIYIRATPSAINIQETYHYKIQISRNPIEPQEDPPKGLLYIELPYDGERYFSKTSWEDFKRQRGNPIVEDARGRIGYLLFWNYQHTNIGRQLKLRDHGVLPIELPLNNVGFLHTEDRVADRYKAVNEAEYMPESPDPLPVTINVIVDDEESIQSMENEDNGRMKTKKLAPTFIVSRFQQELWFTVDISVILPLHIGDKLKTTNAPIRLRSFSLEWPFPTSQRYVQVFIEKMNAEQEEVAGKEAKEERRELIYNPNKRRIEWGNIDFSAGRQEEGPGVYIFHLPSMMLMVEQPGELYGKEFLNGTVVIDIPCLISGTDVALFDACGAKRAEKNTSPRTQDTGTQSGIVRSSRLIVDFKLDPRYCFDKKIYSPYQNIQFEGLTLRDRRVEDITAVLRDLGFREIEVTTLPDPNDPTAIEYCSIETGKAEGPYELRLSLLARGEVKLAEEQVGPRGSAQITKTRSYVGNTEISVRAAMPGKPDPAMKILNEIHRKLKERLPSHARMG